MGRKKTIKNVMIKQMSAALDLLGDHTIVATLVPDGSAVYSMISDNMSRAEVGHTIGTVLAWLVYNGADEDIVQSYFVKMFRNAVAFRLSSLYH